MARSVAPVCVSALAASLLFACAPSTETPKPETGLTVQPASFDDLAGWADDDVSAAVPALVRSCDRLAKLPPTRNVGSGPLRTAAGDWRLVCLQAKALPRDDVAAAREFFETAFQPLSVRAGDNPVGLFTGYFEPELRGAKSPSPKFAVPLYRRPPDLVAASLGTFRPSLKGERIAGRVVNGRLRPYSTRAEIESGALIGRGLELVWVDSAVDAFFLHIQGSGRIRLQDGTVLRVGYDGTNGHVYRSVGRLLIQRGEVAREDMSMQAIRDWIGRNPNRGRDLMAENPSFVFFRQLTGPGPIGAMGVALTPGRSLAIDTRLMPLGPPVWLDTTDPLTPDKPLQRLVVAQDTGGAIRGPVRGDLFWGAGAEAARFAGPMNQRGRYYVLLPRSIRLSQK